MPSTALTRSRTARPAPRPSALPLPKMVLCSRGMEPPIQRGVWRFVRNHPEWSTMRFSIEEAVEYTDDGRPSWIDGLITTAHNEAGIRFVSALGVPAVNVYFDPRNRLPTACVHNRLVGKAAFEHLHSLGLTRFAYLPWPSGPDNIERQEGFFDAARKARMSDRVTVLRNALSTSTWHKDLRAQAAEFRRLTFPVGLFAFSDWLAAMATHALRLAGLDVPGQVALLGVGDDEMSCEGCNPPLSSIDCNLERVGFEAASLLDRIVRTGKAPHKPVLIEPRGVIERTSTQMLAVDDEDVAAALRFIQSRQAAGAPPAADEVAQTMLVSRRTLDTKFKRYLGRSVSDEIGRRQLVAALAMLDGTDLSPRDIANRCGFKTINHLSFVVRKHTGMPPVAYRRSSRPGHHP